MAKQAGAVKFVGTIDMLTGYEMNGQHYVRRKSSLNRKRIRRDYRFRNTRRNAAQFGKAQGLAKLIYCQLEREFRALKTWYRIRNRAQELVRKDLPDKEIKDILEKEFLIKQKGGLSKLKVDKREKAKAEKKAPAPPKEEIFLGRERNEDVVYKLIDQLSAGHALLKNLIAEKQRSTVFSKEKKALEPVLKKFRRRTATSPS